MTSKHYRWQKRWRIDAREMTAIHDNGLLVRFCVPPGIGGARGLAANGQQVIDSLAEKHGHNAASMLLRLMREAVNVYNAPRPH